MCPIIWLSSPCKDTKNNKTSANELIWYKNLCFYLTNSDVRDSLFDAVMTSKSSNNEYVESDIDSSFDAIRNIDISKNFEKIEGYRQVRFKKFKRGKILIFLVHSQLSIFVP